MNTVDDGAILSQSFRLTAQNQTLSGGNDFSAENASSSTKSIPVGKKQQPTFSNVNISNKRRLAATHSDEHQIVSASKKKATIEPTMS